MPFDFEPKLERASTPPPRIYLDPEILDLERRRVFGRTWQLVAHADALAQPGDYVAADVGGEPIVLVRDGETLHAFHNVCRHRAGPVASGCGRRQTLQCAYHGWTYGLDGRLRRAPDMDGCEGFRPEEVALPAARVAAWGPLVFACLDEAAPALDEVLAGIPAPPPMRHVRRKTYPVECNWKVYVDNYLEGYHIPVVHPGLLRELDVERYRVETARWWSLQHAPLRPAASGGASGSAAGGRRYLPRAADDDARYWWVFPNLMLNAYQGQLQTNVVVPLAPERTTVVFDWFAAADVPRLDELVAFSDEIQDEDRAICEAVQRNLRSRAAAPGRYSPRRENGVHHFHGLLHEMLAR